VFERISNSFALAKSSWQVLREDKKLILFPVLSGIACLMVMISFAAPFVVRPQLFDDLQQRAPWVLYVIAFAFYFVNYFVIIFFNSALVSCALMRFNGGEPTLSDGLRAAGLRLPQILMWALVSATVGMILKAVENANEKVGKFISGLLGTVWSIITYFVVPVLVVEKLGPFAAIGRSTAILKKTWGEALIGGLGLGLIIFLLCLPGVLLIFGGVFVIATGAAAGKLALGLILLVLGIICLLAASAVGSALQGIYVSALYQYANQGEAPPGFDQSTMAHAFTAKS
jgi:hypothetical protein